MRARGITKPLAIYYWPFALAAFVFLCGGGFPRNARAAAFDDEARAIGLVALPANAPERELMEQCQVMRKMDQLRGGLTDPENPFQYETALNARLAAAWAAQSPPAAGETAFTGADTGELNDFLAHLQPGAVVRVSAPALKFAGTVAIPSGITVIGAQTAIIDATATQIIFLIEGATGARLAGFNIGGGRVGVYVMHSRFFELEGLNCANSARAIVVQGASEYGRIRHCESVGAAFGGLLIVGPTRRLLVEECRFANGQSYFNWHAGAVLSDTPYTNRLQDEMAFCWDAVATPVLTAATSAPAEILIRNCAFTGNHSSGLYLDGGAGNCIAGNRFLDNDKEGLCLDNGSIFNVVIGNTVAGNGWRRRQTDQDLERDFVLGFGRMADGSAIAKVPGISMDNAARNYVLENVVRENAGDGIKMVRTCFQNVLMFNSLISNNQGQNDRFHFFGILLGSAQPDIESERGVLSFQPCHENIIAHNLIYGAHHSGVLLDRGCAHNAICENTIHGWRFGFIESAATQFNLTVPNYPTDSESIILATQVIKKWNRHSAAAMALGAAMFLLGNAVLAAAIIVRRRARRG